ncbi:yippee-domain-containing protein [Jaminaea rosea]|uniref:Yippee-domain-containing protein n=1 Tax=Jaminaea rosea TaxID=1569628 RepID=A0A316UTS0_9BASI|nr:yippee-domain-containing protein [Jaminaea rosea]PWN28198.1 yippee-domain-containing protein [Jaminaea rosea]
MSQVDISGVTGARGALQLDSAAQHLNGDTQSEQPRLSVEERAQFSDDDVDDFEDHAISSTKPSSADRPALVRLPVTKLIGGGSGGPAVALFVCAQCGTHLALQDEVISKSFSGRDGKAYLFHSSLNTIIGKPEDRQLLTGLHTVADVRCAGCETLVGWTYLRAFEGAQKYKEGRFIMERAAIHKVNNWS